MDALHSLLAFAGWTFALVLVVFLYRGIRILGGAPINHWPRGEEHADDAPFVRRVADAHANCLENLPLFAVLVLVAAAMNKLPLVDGIAPCVVYARVLQSLTHLIGTGPIHVLVRATFWAAQLVVFGLMGWKLLA